MNEMTAEVALRVLNNLIKELEKYDKDAKLKVEIPDNCGGSYLGDIKTWNLNVTDPNNLWLNIG